MFFCFDGNQLFSFFFQLGEIFNFFPQNIKPFMFSSITISIYNRLAATINYFKVHSAKCVLRHLTCLNCCQLPHSLVQLGGGIIITSLVAKSMCICYVPVSSYIHVLFKSNYLSVEVN